MFIIQGVENVCGGRCILAKFIFLSAHCLNRFRLGCGNLGFLLLICWGCLFWDFQITRTRTFIVGEPDSE